MIFTCFRLHLGKPAFDTKSIKYKKYKAKLEWEECFASSRSRFIHTSSMSVLCTECTEIQIEKPVGAVEIVTKSQNEKSILNFPFLNTFCLKVLALRDWSRWSWLSGFQCYKCFKFNVVDKLSNRSEINPKCVTHSGSSPPLKTLCNQF